MKRKPTKEKLCEKNIELSSQFYDCAENYYNSDNFNLGFIPYIFNICFSCELLLKTILFNYGTNTKEIRKQKHCLFNLYCLLPADLKEKIKKDIDNYDVENELEKVNNLFNDIRYYYLNSIFDMSKTFEVNVVFIKKFYKVLLNECKK